MLDEADGAAGRPRHHRPFEPGIVRDQDRARIGERSVQVGRYRAARRLPDAYFIVVELVAHVGDRGRGVGRIDADADLLQAVRASSFDVYDDGHRGLVVFRHGIIPPLPRRCGFFRVGVEIFLATRAKVLLVMAIPA